MEQLGLQQTIRRPVSYTGIALHTGKDVSIRFLPASDGTGIYFSRVDLPQRPGLRLSAEAIISTQRCTTIGSIADNWSIHTIEHLMAAIIMSGIDNMLIEIDSSEPPVTDGSAMVYLDLLTSAGTVSQSKPREIYPIPEPMYVRGDEGILVALPYDGFRISYTLSYTHPVIGTQFADFEITSDLFRTEIAPARTFGFAREVEELHNRGLALGGSLENAVLIGEEKPINSLRFTDEFVRHKVLDLIGDLAVNGHLRGHFIGVKSGHSANAELSKLILARRK